MTNRTPQAGQGPPQSQPQSQGPQSSGVDRATRDDRRQGRPLIGVGGVIFDEAREAVLLIERGAPPAQGLWSVPGGLVERGEALVEACAREVLEETGLRVRLRDQPVKLIDRVLRDQRGDVDYHFLIVDFCGEVISGVAQAASDVRRLRWVPLAKVDALPTTAGLQDAIARARAVLLDQAPSSPLLERLDQGDEGV
jgi:8-oxo-dGTP diphosphatase